MIGTKRLSTASFLPTQKLTLWRLMKGQFIVTLRKLTMREINRKNYLENFRNDELVDVIESLQKKLEDSKQSINTLKQECQRIYESEQFFSGVVHGEVKDHRIDCTQVGPHFIRPRVVFDVCTDDETHVPDCTILEQAQRYCKQLNIEDRMGDGRVDFGGETANDLTGFVEANEQMIRNILTLSDDVLAYLSTLPVGDE